MKDLRDPPDRILKDLCIQLNDALTIQANGTIIVKATIQQNKNIRTEPGFTFFLFITLSSSNQHLPIFSVRATESA